MAELKQLCTFYLDDAFFGVDVAAVQEVLRYQSMTRVPMAPTVVAGLINLRGQIVTAIDLRKRLNLPARPEGMLPANVVLRSVNGATSLLVDSIGEVVEVTEEAFEQPPETVEGAVRELIRGAYKLPTGLLLLIDVDKILDIGREVA